MAFIIWCTTATQKCLKHEANRTRRTRRSRVTCLLWQCTGGVHMGLMPDCRIKSSCSNYDPSGAFTGVHRGVHTPYTTSLHFVGLLILQLACGKSEGLSTRVARFEPQTRDCFQFLVRTKFSTIIILFYYFRFFYGCPFDRQKMLTHFNYNFQADLLICQNKTACNILVQFIVGYCTQKSVIQKSVPQSSRSPQ